MSSPIKHNPDVFRPVFRPRTRDTQPHTEAKVVEKIEEVKEEVLLRTPPGSPRFQSGAIKEISGEELVRLRYAQASMKSETGDGLPLEELTRRMMTDGYDENYPIRVVLMSPSKNDSPNKKAVAYDTRRTSAARAASKRKLDAIFTATVIRYSKHDAAPREYAALEHLTFKNTKIPGWVRDIWIEAWNTWHDESLLKKCNIKVGTWGHLVKLRMAMSTDPSKSKMSLIHSGFKESPMKRASRKVTTGRRSRQPAALPGARKRSSEQAQSASCSSSSSSTQGSQKKKARSRYNL